MLQTGEQDQPRNVDPTAPINLRLVSAESPQAFAPPTLDLLLPKREVGAASERPEVAPELREFLEPKPSNWSKPLIGLGVALALAVIFVWLMFIRPSTRSKVSSEVSTGPAGGATVAYTYAEINAEPWATILSISPANGDAKTAIGQQTPVRVKLPSGTYEVTLQGPNREQKQISINVPEQGGVPCFAVFQKPDLNQLVGPE